MHDWSRVWTTWSTALAARGAVIQVLEVDPPACEEDVVAVERQLGRGLPTSLREVLLGFSAHVRFKWYLEGGPTEPRPLEDLARCGELEWSYATLVRYRTEHDDLSDDIEMYGAEGATRLTETVVFQEVGNGDSLAIDFRTGAVVYLDHEGGTGDGAVLAPSFQEFVERYSAIGCSGPDWEILRSICRGDGIDPSAPVAQQWRAWVGLPETSSAV